MVYFQFTIIMRWDVSDHSDNRVVNYTGWRYFSKVRTFQEQPGVYVFANTKLCVRYIGKARYGRMTFEILSAIDRGRDLGALLVKVLYTATDEGAVSLESALIEKYRPPNNNI
ncbi:hypothetical protein A3K69_07315 [Candidatus Bathyarchaeota archaeon RBG_16_57_9]|nr:MAG: hypothetical protein A3K69_07315 [Candidatus Bathyarchaeota archaeon RBG_16_57_9]OGD52590.1 MAG: hypothetical protein A3K81_05340 [Candidatus Bathyarchaeota archaeon RBG_13_60_20]